MSNIRELLQSNNIQDVILGAKIILASQKDTWILALSKKRGSGKSGRQRRIPYTYRHNLNLTDYGQLLYQDDEIAINSVRVYFKKYCLSTINPWERRVL